MYCNKCGEELKEGVKFCKKCGAKISGKAELVSAPESSSISESASATESSSISESASAPESSSISESASVTESASTSESASAPESISTSEAKPSTNSNKSKKTGIIIAAVIGVIAIIAAIIVIVLITSESGSGLGGSGDKKYRVIKLDSYKGTVSLNRSGDDVEVFESMNLKSEDTVTTGEDGMAVLLVDSDKHIGAKENTSFNIVADGNEDHGRVSIELIYGEALFTIDNKLPDGSTFEVNTSNAALSVRGTEFITRYNANKHETYVEVITGLAWVSSGQYEVILEPGQYAIITDDNTKEFEHGNVEDIDADASAGDENSGADDEEDMGEIIDEASVITPFEPESVYVISEASVYADGSGKRKTGYTNAQFDEKIQNVTIYLEKQGDGNYLVSFGGNLATLGSIEARYTDRIDNTGRRKAELSGERLDTDVDERVSVNIDFVKGTFGISYDNIEWYRFQFSVGGELEPGTILAEEIDRDKLVLAKVNGENAFSVSSREIKIDGEETNVQMSSVSYKLVKKDDVYIISFSGQLEPLGYIELEDHGHGNFYGMIKYPEGQRNVEFSWGNMELYNLSVIVHLSEHQADFEINGNPYGSRSYMHIIGTKKINLSKQL